MTKGRDRTVDLLRGLAIIIMIAANSSATTFAEPHPFWFRCLSSVAAPMFITLSGMMVRFSQIRKKYPFPHFLKRGVMLIGVAAFLDVAVWQMYPCTSFDVLYVIGISAPIAFLFGRIDNKTLHWATICAICLLTPVLQHVFGYTPYPSEFRFNGSYYLDVENQTSVLNHLFIDGWFPIFPWIGFSLFGVMLANYRWMNEDVTSFCNKSTALVALGCLSIGIVLKVMYPVHLYVRDGFGEVFYPPTVGFCVYTAGIVLGLFCVFDSVGDSRLLEPLATIGRSSLLLYILHWFCINYVLSVYFGGLDGLRFALLWLLFVVIITAVAYGLNALKLRWRRQPWFIRFLLGG